MDEMENTNSKNLLPIIYRNGHISIFNVLHSSTNRYTHTCGWCMASSPHRKLDMEFLAICNSSMTSGASPCILFGRPQGSGTHHDTSTTKRPPNTVIRAFSKTEEEEEALRTAGIATKFAELDSIGPTRFVTGCAFLVRRQHDARNALPGGL